MTDYKRIAILIFDGKSRRQIAASCKTSSKTITKVQKYLNDNKITRNDLEMINNEELKENISPNKKYKTTKESPDYDAAHISLMKGETVKALWDEYSARCKASNIERISYTRFFELVKENEDSLRATEDKDIRAGELCIAKWLNRSVETVDEDGVAGKAYVFMVYFPLSQHIFLYGSADKSAETTERFISNCFDGIGSAPQKMMTDNVRCFYSNKGDWRSQLVHLCAHYGIRIVPAETVSPQVLFEHTFITKKIEKTVRDKIYRSVDGLDDFLGEIQQAHASECVHKAHTRETIFKDEVRFMKPIPQNRYEAFTEEIMTIQYNQHIAVGGTYYSVPYTAYLADKFVKVRIYAGRIEIYQGDVMIARHRRTSGRYSTYISHMPPPDVLDKLPWNGRRLREWAACIGPETYRVIDGIIGGHVIEQQCYVTCINILKLQDKYGVMLESACAAVPDRSVMYSYRIISDYLKQRRSVI